MTLAQFDLIELNEAFAAQGLAVLRMLGLQDDDTRVDPNGGAIALGHPLGMSGARLVATASCQLQRSEGRFALCTMCSSGCSDRTYGQPQTGGSGGGVPGT